MSAFDFDEFPALETPRLRLRQIVEEDRGAWLAAYNSPGVIDWLIEMEEPPSEDDMAGSIFWSHRVMRKWEGLRWALTLKPYDRLIGTCGFHNYRQKHRSAEIGYELHSGYWRRGLMSEAVAAVVRFCFEQVELHRLWAEVTEGNVASAALLTNMGFQLEGTRRECNFWRGGYHSLWQYSLLAHEYRAWVEAERET